MSTKSILYDILADLRVPMPNGTPESYRRVLAALDKEEQRLLTLISHIEIARQEIDDNASGLLEFSDRRPLTAKSDIPGAHRAYR